MSAFMFSDENFDAIAATLAGWSVSANYALKNLAQQTFAKLKTPERSAKMPARLDEYTAPEWLFSRWAEELAEANAKSVNCRYYHSTPAEKAEIFGIGAGGQSHYKCQIAKGRKLDLIQFIKVMHCLDYQSCEVNNWEESQIAKEIQATTTEAEATFIRQSAEYNAAKWGI